MNLESICIENFRSIDKLELKPSTLSDGSLAFGLIGVNESGKSSLLKAIAWWGGNYAAEPRDVRDGAEYASVRLIYSVNPEEIEKIRRVVVEGSVDLANALANLKCFGYEVQRSRLVHIAVKKYVAILHSGECVDLPVELIFDLDFHSTIFWTAEDRYLISQPIELTSFAAQPERVSIPLSNCFSLAGLKRPEEIQSRIILASQDAAENQLLCQQLGEAVTDHIKRIWPGHPVTITFVINAGAIHFLVNDDGVRARAKTTDQRSDGFKQFISFLLTISVQNRNEDLHNAILLLDEPETHLHPKAQESLLRELIDITCGGRGVLVYFATHSGFMIDKQCIERNFKIAKTGCGTVASAFQGDFSTFASINYEVFEVISNDYHSELYGKLHERFIARGEKGADKQRSFDERFFREELGLLMEYPLRGVANSATLCTYVRNCINHPEANNKFSSDNLRESINIMRKAIGFV